MELKFPAGTKGLFQFLMTQSIMDPITSTQQHHEQQRQQHQQQLSSVFFRRSKPVLREKERDLLQ